MISQGLDSSSECVRLSTTQLMTGGRRADMPASNEWREKSVLGDMLS